jgi:hypothetical protein
MKKTLPVIAAIIIVGALSFYGGFSIGNSKNVQANSLQSGQRNFGGVNGQGMNGQGGPGINGNTSGRNMLPGNLISGQIISADDKSITVKLLNGGSKIVFFSGSTKITKSVEAAISDLISGISVTANGTANSDGSITAKTIQIRPELPQNPAGTQQGAKS